MGARNLWGTLKSSRSTFPAKIRELLRMTVKEKMKCPRCSKDNLIALIDHHGNTMSLTCHDCFEVFGQDDPIVRNEE